VCHFSVAPAKALESNETKDFQTEKGKVTFHIVNLWKADSSTGYQSGYQVNITIENTQQLQDWKLCWSEEDKIDQYWNAQQETTPEGLISLSGTPWNTTIAPGNKITIGYIAYSKQNSSHLPTSVQLLSSDVPVNIPPVNTPPVNTPPVNTPPVNTPPVNTPPVNTPPVDHPSENPSSSGPFATTPMAQPATRSLGGKKIVLTVQGPKIVDDQGQEILLKGLDRPSLEWNPQGQHLSAEEIGTMKTKWNATVVRISLNQNYWFSSQDASTPGSYKQIIDGVVASCIKNDMAVVLDLHWTENGHQNPMANKESLLFWKEVATAYKDFGTVIFEPFNEPYGVTPEVWLHGNNQYAGFQELVDEIRKTGAQNICIINGLDWAYDLSFVNDKFHVQGENLIYGSHPYNEKLYKDKNHHQSTLLDENNFKGVLGIYPLIFTEFGVNDNAYFNAGDYQKIYQDILKFCNDHHVHYTAWAWWNEPGNPAFPCLIGDWSGTPINGGVFIKEDMIYHPGTNLH
jgi:hypothetical protein